METAPDIEKEADLSGEKSKTQQHKLKKMQIFNQSKSNSPRLNKTDSNKQDNEGKKKSELGATAFDQPKPPPSTIEFEAKKDDSGCFSSDSDFDRNMDEMESDFINNEHFQQQQKGP